MKAKLYPRKLPVVILNMHYTGLGIARDLKDSGAEIYGVSHDATFFGNFSKYCTALHAPDTETEPEKCKEFLLTFAQSLGDRPILLPTRDHDINFIISYRRELEAAYLIPYPSSEVLEQILDKSRLYTIAKQVPIYCPKDVVINSLEELNNKKNGLIFPCVVKPVRASQWRKKMIWDLVGKQKVVKIDDYDDLYSFYERIHKYDPVIHVQEYIEGKDTNLVIFGSYINPHTGMISYFTARKLLQYPANSGTGIIVESCVVHDIIKQSIALLRQLNYSGISEIEYKYDERKGVYALIEINPRHWDQHTLGSSVGVNLSQTMYSDMSGLKFPFNTQYNQTIRWIADDGYFSSLLNSFRKRDYPLSVLIRILVGRKIFAVFHRKDLRPAIHLYKQMLAEYRKIFCNHVKKKLAIKRVR